MIKAFGPCVTSAVRKQRAPGSQGVKNQLGVAGARKDFCKSPFTRARPRARLFVGEVPAASHCSRKYVRPHREGVHLDAAAMAKKVFVVNLNSLLPQHISSKL